MERKKAYKKIIRITTNICVVVGLQTTTKSTNL